jgi:uncharacterized protein YciI
MKITVLLCTFLSTFTFLSCNNTEEAKKALSATQEELRLKSENAIISKAAQIKKLKDEGYQIFDYVEEASGDTIIMQQYYMAFLKRGAMRDWTKEESDSIQTLHMNHLTRMYLEGYADISGPFGDDQEVRGITIYNVPTLRMADSLANLDPSVKAGNLVVEVRPWWAGKGVPLR